MRSVNIHEAKTHLSRLVNAATNGESFIIARAGKPMVKVISVETPKAAPKRRLDFLNGYFQTPEDFDYMTQNEIEEMFEAGSEHPA